MKKVLAITLLLGFLGANTELHQLAKLPVLIHHFFEHQRQQHNESLVQFLAEHYQADPSHCIDNHNDHENLPFKTHDCAAVHSSTEFNAQSSFSLSQPVAMASDLHVPVKMMMVPSAFSCTIWQPPKTS